jgi:hypothetical protein
MASVIPPLAFKNALVELVELIPAVLGSPQRRIVFYERICADYRRMGIASLLISGDPRDFYAYLSKSARALVHFAEGADADERITSKGVAFLDAVASRDDEAARRLAAAFPRTAHPTREYEEDFLHVRTLMDLYTGADPSTIAGLLAAWQKLADANPDPRLDVCKAIAARDQGAFDDALAAAIQGMQAETEKRRERDQLKGDDAATTAVVSVDVLCWIELAERAGLDVQREYPLAPSLARRFARLALPPPHSWQTPG